MVEGVEEFSAEVQVLLLGEVELFADGEVEVEEAGSAFGADAGVAELTATRLARKLAINGAWCPGNGKSLCALAMKSLGTSQPP